MSLLPNPAFAWYAAGHRIIAQIAYDNLEPAVKRQVIALNSVISKMDHQSRRFEQAATWADQIIFQDVSAFNSWHYIDIPFSHDNMPLPIIAKPNVVWAITEAQQVLRSRKANTFQKALFLRFLIHFVGDIHQPLHCITKISQAHPHGDEGGNNYPITAKNSKNLHQYWDKSLGLYEQYQLSSGQQKRKLIRTWATDLQSRYSKVSFSQQLANDTPQHWANESFELARSFVYTMPEHTAPMAAYIKHGQVIVEQRIVLAGYRLAAMLNEIFLHAVKNRQKE